MSNRWAAVLLALIILSLFPNVSSEDLSPTVVLDFGSFIADIVIDEGRSLAYISARDLDAVIVLALGNLTQTATIPVGDRPMRMDVDSGMERLYVALSAGQGVAVVNLDTQQVETTWTIGGEVEEVIVGTRSRIYVSGAGISALNSMDGSIVWWRNALRSVLALSPDGQFLYSGGLYSLPADVEKLDVQTDTPVSMGRNRDTNSLSDLALSPDGTRLYLAARYQTQGTCRLAVLDTSTMNVSNSIPDCEPLAVVSSPDGTRILAGSNLVYGYDSTTGEIVDSYGGTYGYVRAVRVNQDRSLVLVSQTDYTQPDANRLIVYRADRLAPVADAGVDQVVEQGTVVILDGSGSTDNVAVDNFAWSFTDARPVALQGARPSYRFAHIGIFEIRLAVRDPSGNTDSDTVAVTVIPPPLLWIPSSMVLILSVIAAVVVCLALRRLSKRPA